MNINLTRIEDSYDNILADLAHGKLAIKNDVTADLPYDEILWTNDDASRLYAVAAQKYWDGGAFVFCDAGFDKLEVNDATDGLLVARYIRGLADTDTRFDWYTGDAIKLTVGGVDIWSAIEGSSDYFIVDPNGSGVRVGIGTPTPGMKLEIVESKSSAATAFRHRNSATGNTANIVEWYHNLNDDGAASKAALHIESSFSNIAAATAEAHVRIRTRVNNNLAERITFDPTETVFNNDSYNIDHRFEGDGDSDLCVMDAGLDMFGVGVPAGSHLAKAHIRGKTASSGSVTDVLIVERYPSAGLTTNDGAAFLMKLRGSDTNSYEALGIEASWLVANTNSRVSFYDLFSGSPVEMLRLGNYASLGNLAYFPGNVGIDGILYLDSNGRQTIRDTGSDEIVIQSDLTGGSYLGVLRCNAKRIITSVGDFIVDSSSYGVILKDSASSHFWRIVVSSSGALSTVDLGTSLP